MVTSDPQAPDASPDAPPCASQIQFSYYGGPCDGQTEIRPTPPQDGELVHRLVGQRYVTYRWNQSRFLFALVS